MPPQTHTAQSQTDDATSPAPRPGKGISYDDPSTWPAAETFFPDRRSLTAFHEAVDGCRACPLWRDATQGVFGEGPRDARLMLVGEQPGDSEDLEGRPFVGSSGRLLDEYLEEAGLDRSELFVTNAVKHFKHQQRGKRRIHDKPNRTEVTACIPWFEAEVELVAPAMIVCLGATAARAVIGPNVRVTKDRGRVFESRFASWVMPTYHPSALLRAPAEVRKRNREAFREDLAAVAKRYAETS